MHRILWCIAVGLLLWLGCAGVGLSIVSARRAVRTAGATSAEEGSQGGRPSWWSQSGLAACVGLAALLAVGSVSTVLALRVLAVTWMFICCGLALLARRVLPGPWARPGAGVVIWSAVILGAFGLVQVAQALFALSSFFPTPCDDLLAYIPMAQRVLDTGQLIEPWSLRRLQNLGGQSFLQAFSIGTSGQSAFGIPETLTASTFLAGLFVTNGFRRVSSRLCCVAVILAVPMMTIPRANSAAALLTVPLLVASFMAVCGLRTALSTGNEPLGHRWAIAGGLLVAACLSLRLHVVPAAGAVLAIGILTASAASWRTRVKTLLVGVGTALGATVGWSLGSWQSSGTPLFPVIGGNVNPAVASSRDPALTGVVDNIARTVELLQAGEHGPFVIAILAVLVLAVAMRGRLPDARLLYVVAGAALGNIVLLAGFLTLASETDFNRYLFPIPAAVVVFFLYETIGSMEAIDSSVRGASFRPLFALAAAVLAFGYVFAPNPALYKDVYLAVRPGVVGGLSKDGHNRTMEDALATPEVRSDYRRAVESLRGRGRVIAAVDRPYLIDLKTDDIPSLDLAGWAAPGGDFPLFGSTLAKVQLLRSRGYEQLLATVPEVHRCMNPVFLRHVVETYPRPGPLLASYHVAWVNSLIEIRQVAPGAVRQFGSALIVIDLAEAESILREAAPRVRAHPTDLVVSR